MDNQRPLLISTLENASSRSHAKGKSAKNACTHISSINNCTARFTQGDHCLILTLSDEEDEEPDRIILTIPIQLSIGLRKATYKDEEDKSCVLYAINHNSIDYFIEFEKSNSADASQLEEIITTALYTHQNPLNTKPGKNELKDYIKEVGYIDLIPKKLAQVPVTNVLFNPIPIKEEQKSPEPEIMYPSLTSIVLKEAELQKGHQENLKKISQNKFSEPKPTEDPKPIIQQQSMVSEPDANSPREESKKVEPPPIPYVPLTNTEIFISSVPTQGQPMIQEQNSNAPKEILKKEEIADIPQTKQTPISTAVVSNNCTGATPTENPPIIKATLNSPLIPVQPNLNALYCNIQVYIDPAKILFSADGYMMVYYPSEYKYNLISPAVAKISLMHDAGFI